MDHHFERIHCKIFDLFKVLIYIGRWVHKNAQHFNSWSNTSSQSMHVLLYLKINISSGFDQCPSIVVGQPLVPGDGLHLLVDCTSQGSVLSYSP